METHITLRRTGTPSARSSSVGGNTVMSGYYKDATATEGGCARATSACGTPTGTSGSSSIEVEFVRFGHAAVVAWPDDDHHWGMTPCVFVTLKDGTKATETETLRVTSSSSAEHGCRKDGDVQRPPQDLDGEDAQKGEGGEKTA
nr:unnamed protein product [Digitaria exilis]